MGFDELTKHVEYVLATQGFLERDFSWSSIEAATGIDEAAFRKFKRQLDATDDGPNT